MAASIEEARQKAAASRAREEDLSARIAALPASTSTQEAVELCEKFGDLRDVPVTSRARCGESYLAKGRESLAAARPAEAVALLEKASALVPSNADVASTLSWAGVMDRSGATQAVRSEAGQADRAGVGQADRSQD
ncbi:hypothetical protein [Myxococcus sp. Y35]|uniref:hypothetical protein n=1 Tax=Pseudomyxococcus flavus TaxID=3115648 RepID=UPI003CEB742D